jgi:uncharacterized SAM-binding protein YcdF (DUF218 family)
MIDYLGWRDVGELVLLPPGNLICLLLAALLLWWRRPRLAAWLAGLAVLLLYLFSIPIFANAAIRTLEVKPLDPGILTGRSDAAIVVLSADLVRDQPEYGGATIGGYTLERMRYAARLHRATGLPILVSGGVLHDDAPPIAVLMKESFETDFAVPVRWVEAQSRTTFENAIDSVALLRRDGIRTAVIVTHSWHMRRALDAFAATGIDCIAAPTVFTPPLTRPELRDFLPRASALGGTYFALHEWVGRGWYALLKRVAFG